jgi:hypothetical protein
MANGFDFANIGQMFSGMAPGAAPTGLDALLNEEQRRLLGRNAALSAAAALLQASAPSRQRIGLGQALGSALQAGQAGYQQARAGALQDVMLGEKLKEAQQARQLQQRVAGVFAQPQPELTPAQQALAAPGMQVGPTMQRAEVMAAIEPPTQAQINAAQYMRAADILAAAGKTEEAQRYMTMAEKLNPRDEVVGQPFEVTDSAGKPVMVQQFKSGKLQTMAGFGPKREVVLQNLGGQTVAVNKSALRGGETFQQTLTPAEAGNLAVAQGNLRVAQGNLGIRQQEFARGVYDVRETPEGLAYVPKMPGGAAMPVVGAGGEQVKGAGGTPTEGQLNAAGFAQRMELASSIINSLPAGSQPGVGTGIAGAVPLAGGTLARLIQNPNTQKYAQAAKDWIRAKLRKESGAVIGEKEESDEYITYFPQVGDSADVIMQKVEARRVATEAMKKSAGRAYTPYVPPAPAVAPTMRPARLVYDPATGNYRYVQE